MIATPTSSTLQRQQWQQEALSRCLEDAINTLSAEQIYNHPAHNFKRSGDRLRGGCPLHQSSSGSSFVVTISSKLFWCEGCQFGGGPAYYRASLKAGRWVKVRGKDFVETALELAADANIRFPEQESSPESIAKAQKWEQRRAVLAETQNYCQEVLWSDRVEALEARHYLVTERGLTEEEIKLLPIGYYPSAGELKRHLISKGFTEDDWKGTGCYWKEMERYITFLWNDANGRPLTIYGRYFKQHPPEGKPKTIASPGEKTKQSPLYFDRALKAGHKELVLVEGVLDAVLLQAKGDTRCCAYVAASCSGDQIETLKRRGITKVTLCGDPDHGGEKGTNSNLLRLSEADISVYVAPKLPDGLDPDEFLIRQGMEGWKAHIDAANHGFRWKAQRLIEAGNTSTDSGKAEVLRDAIAFCKAVKNHPDLDVFFWPIIRNSLGMESEEFRAQLEKLWESSPAEVTEFGGGSGSSGGDDSDGGVSIVEGSKPSSDKSSSLSIREVVAKAEEILGTETDSLVQKIKLEELRQQAGINSYEWNVEYVNLIRNKLERQLAQDSRKEHRRQALLALACEKDPDEREDSIVALCRKSGWSRKYLESRIESLKAEEIKPKAKRMTFREFMEAENEPIKWIYSGLIPSLGVTLFCGDAGVGKSSAATDLAVSFVTGDEFLGEVSGLPGRVLYLMADEPSGYVQERLMHRLPLIECPQFETISNWDVSQMDLLVETIKDFKPNLVVVDGYNAIHATDPNYDENSSKAGKTIRTFDALSQTYGCGFVVIHHNGKGKDLQGVHKVRGSTDIPAAASTVLLFEKCPNGVYRRIKVEKTRSGTGNRSLTVGFDESTKRLVLVNSDEDKETKSLSQYIFDFLKGNQGTFFEQAEIQQQMQLNNSNSVYAALKRLANRSQIVRRPSKKINAGKRCLIYGIPATVTPPQNTKETPPPVCVKVSDLEAENYTHKGVDKSYIKSDTKSDINLTCELVADSQNSENPCNVDDSLNLTYEVTEGGVSPDLDTSDSTVTVANDEALAPDPWEEKYEYINVDADGWGEIVLVSSQAPTTPAENEPEATEAVENEQTSPAATPDAPTDKASASQVPVTAVDNVASLTDSSDITVDDIVRFMNPDDLPRSRQFENLDLRVLGLIGGSVAECQLPDGQKQTFGVRSLKKVGIPISAEPASVMTASEDMVQPIQMGDRVNWDNCPGHWGGWAPFVVVEIYDDGFCKLDIAEPGFRTPISELRLVD